METNLEAKMRHQQYILFYSGLAVLAFGIWSTLKIVISLSVHPIDWSVLVDFSDIADIADDDLKILNLISNVMFVAVSSLSVFFRLYLCRSAMRDAVGRKKSIIYLIWATLLFHFDVTTTIGLLGRIIAGTNEALILTASEQTLTSTFIELTSHMALLLLVVSAVRLRWLRKKIQKQTPSPNTESSGE